MNRGVFAQVIDHDQGMATAVAEILRYCHSGVGCEPLQAGRAVAVGDYKDTALNPAMSAHRLDRLAHRGRTLADRDIDRDHVGAALVDDGVDTYSALAG